MQLAKIIMDNKERNIINKFLEILFSLRIEFYNKKNNILYYYLSYAPYGYNVRGFQAASLFYFGKYPEDITWAEAATLAVIPNKPNIINYPEKLKEKRDLLLQRLFKKGFISKDIYQFSLKEPVIIEKRVFKKIAPHLSTRLYLENSGIVKKELLNSSFDLKVIKTTIDTELQEKVVSIVKSYIDNFKDFGIKNIAVIIGETKTGYVRVYIGSQNFFDKDEGFVDGVLSARSPGSTLKPFLYALSIDEGLITPLSLIRDVPSFFKDFSPANFDRKYRGLVRVDTALIDSLNVPAVYLLNSYGLSDFYSFLKESGVSTLFRKPEEYGLSLILGSCEISLFELASLYRELGNYGVFGRLSVIERDEGEKKRLISKTGSYLILEVLKEVKRPDFDYYWKVLSKKPIAWKTGTSYGLRDAIAVGVTPDWVVAIWMGNFTGEGNPMIVGKRAAPLLFKIFDILPGDSWFEVPYDDIKIINICTKTGYLATNDCPDSRQYIYPKSAKQLKKCPYHKSFFVTEDGNFRIKNPMNYKRKYYKKSFLIFPPSIEYFINRIVLEKVPPFIDYDTDNQLEIIYPQSGIKIFIPKDLTGVQSVKARAVSKKNVKLYWYIDDKFLGITRYKHEILFNENSGEHILTVIDENGNKASVNFYIE